VDIINIHRLLQLSRDAIHISNDSADET